ncbi:MAG: extracellular solute-binding protein [Aristaeellaceae bacterium]
MKRWIMLFALLFLSGQCAYAQDAIPFPPEQGEAQVLLSVAQDGAYYLQFDYASLPSDFLTIEMSLLLDDARPFEEADRLVLARPWQDDTPILQDSRGNSLLPRQSLSQVRRKAFLQDREFKQNEPYAFFLTAGEHVLTIRADRGDFVLYDVACIPAGPVRSFDRYRSDLPTAKADTRVVIEAEEMHLRSDSALVAQYVRNDAAVSPSDAGRMLLNAAGGSSWSSQGQWIAWEAVIEDEGWYQISFKAKQPYKSGISVYRRLLVDGEVPYAELDQIAFADSSAWQLVTPGSIYLTKGTHELALEVVPGPMAASAQVVSDVLLRLNSLYRAVIAVTGNSIDEYRDYELDDVIPNLVSELNGCADILDEEYGKLLQLSGKGGSDIAVVSRLRDEMRLLAAEPDNMPGRISAWKSDIDALAVWLISIQESPLDLDQIILTPPDEVPVMDSATLLETLGFRIQSLLASFSPDYGIVGDLDSDEALEVWIGLGRDQLGILKDLVDEQFTPQTGIQVNVNLVQQGLTEAILANTAPDVALYVASPDLAYRGALLPLDGMEGFDALAAQFNPQTLVQDTYQGHVYGFALTQSFPVLFYRTDIFEELSLEPPQTWSELLSLIPVLQREGLEVGVPAAETTYSTLLYQMGGSYYKDDLSATRFEEEVALDAFKMFTSFYADYSLAQTYDFYNRFRSGQMPLAIADYTEYNRLQVAAPEIRGLWAMTLLPGTQDAAGNINRSVTVGTSSAVVLAGTEMPREAWEFLKWFASADVQSAFGVRVEAVLGASGRYAAANTEAFERLPWLKEQRQIITSQRDWVVGIPPVPGSYYVSRDIMNAFRAVVISYRNPRDTLVEYNERINREIERKRIEFGLVKEVEEK